MPYPKCKIYYDRSHYIAIPHTTRPYRPRRKPKEEVITVTEVTEEERKEEQQSAPPVVDDGDITPAEDAGETDAEGSGQVKIPDTPAEPPKGSERLTTKKELFEELYKESQRLPRKYRKRFITGKMLPYFKDRESAAQYVTVNMLRKTRNMISRRIRLSRKAALHLHDFTHFVTFTYSDELHTEETFKKQLKTCLRHLCERKSWRYIGVWERSPEKHRLHFHGLFIIPEGTMPGILYPKEDYSFKTHRRQVTMQNTYFNEQFGRCDFEALEDTETLGWALAYIMKYLEKTGEKIVYSKGLPQFFVSDVMDEEIICPFGLEDKKLLLHDDFGCWDEGCYMGKVSREVIAQMPKEN